MNEKLEKVIVNIFVAIIAVILLGIALLILGWIIAGVVSVWSFIF